MIILGLGSNMGDRLLNLRNALQAIKSIPDFTVKQVSPVYISDALMPENAPAEWDMPYLNLAMRCQSSLNPVELLKQLKNIEWSIGRKPEVRHWGPRIIDIDILAWNDVVIQSEPLTVPHASLQERPFALWPLADVAPMWKFPLSGANQGKTAAQMVEAWGSRFSGNAPFHTRQINQRVDTSRLVGIVNITPDSFSDGGKFLEPEKALQQIIHLVNAGAEIIDIGAESTAPSAAPLDADTEWKRLEPVMSAIRDARSSWMLSPKISVDTRHSRVAEQALLMGADWINDVSGLDDPGMREILAGSAAECVVMHHMSIPERRNHVLPRHQDPVKAVYEWGVKRLHELEKQGITRDRVIFDPGIGFGKMAEQSLILLKNIHVFASLGTRVLVGHSRKTFLSLLSGMPFADRDIETMVMSLFLARHAVDYIRVHNVEICARGLRVSGALETLA
ncbi:Dihydropteroate synthase [Aquicella siphonis]|uniref:Dihydropteroate synthase n=1 Tax=Aquicella siphonis TaxID=254247 RepID=A0A5E4PDS9_9COXI|nr:dihydropteroate synthase [Aquicella siphonis]VVC74732.1 Dihydropteroate synthase [Aquicella siphonis]